MGKIYSWSDIVKKYDVPVEPPSTAAFAVVDGILALSPENQRAVWLEIVETLLTTSHRNNVRANIEGPIMEDVYEAGEITPPVGWKPKAPRVRQPVLRAGEIPVKTTPATTDRYERWTKLDPLAGFETSKFGWVIQIKATREEWKCRRADQLARQQHFQKSLDYCDVALADMDREGVDSIEELLKKRGLL